MEKYLYKIGEEVSLPDGRLVKIINIDENTNQIVAQLSENGQIIERNFSIKEIKRKKSSGYIKS